MFQQPYLITILTSYPGMIDELLDCLILDHLPTKKSLRRVMNELVKGAQIEGQELIDVILAFFQTCTAFTSRSAGNPW